MSSLCLLVVIGLKQDGIRLSSRRLKMPVTSDGSQDNHVTVDIALQRHLQNMRFSHKGLGGVKHHFPLLFVPGKPPFYMVKFGQHTKVTL